MSPLQPKSASPFDIFASARALWRHRDLLWQFTLRNIELRHKGSVLGFVWSVLNPLLMLAIYVFIFGYIFPGRFDGVPHETKVDYALALFLGLTMFQAFAEIIAVAPTIIVANPNFVKKVVFPLEVLPAATVGGAFFHMSISLTLVLLGIVTVGPGFHLAAKLLWLPVIFLSLIPLALGIAWLFAALGVFFRDINQVTTFLITALMYASAIFFPLRVIPHLAWEILRFNPFLLAVDLARSSAMWVQPVNLTHLGYLWLAGLGCCYVGHWFFRKTSPAFADVL